jgi:membrane protease subunit HflC
VIASWRIAAAFLALFVLNSAIYTVDETEQVILVQFGRPVGGLVKEPGLHVKIPFIQVVHRFDKRWL